MTPLPLVDPKDSTHDYIDAVAQMWLEHARSHAERGHWEQALRSAQVAARTRSVQNRHLVWPGLEAFLGEAAAHLLGPGDSVHDGAATDPLEHERTKPLQDTCLHVLSEALPAGGLTAMARRWIERDTAHAVHHVALLDPTLGVPRALRQAVEARYGSVHAAPPDMGLVQRARWLHQLARRIATRVVLHVDPADILCSLAFSLRGGPPVMLVNHTAHSFWVGVSTADLVLNCRGSALESQWTRVHRGALKQATVPIPLGENTPEKVCPDRSRARAAWGLREDQVALLTVGSAFKYRAIPEADFVATYERLLSAAPQAVLLAVGFDGDKRWQTAEAATQGRIRTLGTLPESALSQLHVACDLYVEGFPFGTTTALLEASGAGLPVVLAPGVCPAPYATDGLALDDTLVRDKTLADYEATVTRLINDAPLRRNRANMLTPSVREHHAGAGWQRHVNEALSALPQAHEIHNGSVALATPKAVHGYWMRHSMQWTATPTRTLERSLLWGLQAEVSLPSVAAMRTVCQAHASARDRWSIPLGTLSAWRIGLVSWAPATWSAWVLRAAAWLRAPDALARWQRRWSASASKGPTQGAYEEYRRWGRQSNLAITWAPGPQKFGRLHRMTETT